MSPLRRKKSNSSSKKSKKSNATPKPAAKKSTGFLFFKKKKQEQTEKTPATPVVRATASRNSGADLQKESKKSLQKQIQEKPSDAVAPQYIPPAPQPLPQELPDGYGDNHIYLLVRDPYWIYSYWELQSDWVNQGLAKLNAGWDDVRTVLRVFDITDGEKNKFYDIVLQGLSRNWYVNVEPNHSYVVEIGLLHRDGRFVTLARSNEVRTPRSGMSEIVDEKWMGLDFDRMYALSGGFEVGKSSAELKKLMEERLMGAITSGSGAGVISSISSPVKIKQRGFRFWLECELIVYGGTEPDATVIMQGKKIQLRPDGTFSFRFALPDGKIVLDTHAHSADGVEERTITPIVERRTERPAPRFKKEFHGKDKQPTGKV